MVSPSSAEMRGLPFQTGAALASLFYNINVQKAGTGLEERGRDMKISRIETFHVPPRGLFVRVETGDGAFGWGEASLEGHAEAVAGAFEAFRDRFIGHDPRRIEDIWQVAYRGG